MYMGSGGAPEGVLAAAALKCMGGQIFGRLMFRNDGEALFIDDVSFGSAAADAGLDWDQEVLRVLRPVGQPSKYLMFLPALLLLALVVFLQRGRTGRAARKPATA